MKTINNGIENHLKTSVLPSESSARNIHIRQCTGENRCTGIYFNLAKLHNSSNIPIGDGIKTPNSPQERLNNQERVSLVLKWVNMPPQEREKYDVNGGIKKFVSDNNAHYSQFMDLCRMGGNLSARGMGCLRRVARISGPKITAKHIIEWQNMSPKNRIKMGGLNAFAAKYMLPSTRLYRLISSNGKIKPAGLTFLSKKILCEQCLHTPKSSHVYQTIAAQPSTELYYALWAIWENDASQGADELRSNAVTLMRDCLERKGFILNLSKLSLTSLPDIIPEHILELNVSNNYLSMLPESLPPNLQRLLIADNACTALPQVLPEHLSELCLRNNVLTKFPEHLPDTIAYLNISFNKMEGAISHLTDSLISLDLSNNKLNSIPDSLPRNLTWIDLSNNHIQTLPECVMTISQKTEIDLVDNPLTEQTLTKLYSACYPSNSAEPKNIYF